jgi:hypothetical protein
VGRVKQGFVFEDAVKKFEISTGDRPVVAERVYRRFLARTWTDLSLTDRESELLNWAAGCLGIPAAKASQLNQEAAADCPRGNSSNTRWQMLVVMKRFPNEKRRC